MNFLYYFSAFIIGDIFGFFSFWNFYKLQGGKILYYIPSTSSEGHYSIINKIPILWYFFERWSNDATDKKLRLRRFKRELAFGLVALVSYHLYGLTSKAIVLFAFIIIFSIIHRVIIKDAFLYYPLIIFYSLFSAYYLLTGNSSISISIVSFLLFIICCFSIMPVDFRRILIGISLLLLISGYFSVIIFILINSLSMLNNSKRSIFLHTNYYSLIILLLIGDILADGIMSLI
ncbi:MAG: hypothetical protein ACUVWP_01495 [bacterium]